MSYKGQQVASGGRVYGLNPATGQWEPLFLDESDLEPGGGYTFQNTGTPVNEGTDWSDFDKFMSGAIQVGAGAGLGYGAATALGVGGAAGAAGATGDTAIAGGAGVDAMTGTAAGASGTAGGTAATAGLTDIGGGMFLDASGNVVGAGSTAASTGGAGAGAGLYDLGGGMSVDAYGNVVSGGAEAGAGAGMPSFLSNPALIGAGLGGILGGTAGGSKPAGTTTSTQDVPAWLMPYVTGNLDAASTARNKLLASPNAADAALPEYLKTIRGDYLDPATNPYLDATYKHAAGLVGAGVDSRFEAAGRYGSGAHQGVLQEGLGNLATGIYGGNFQAERARQAAAVTGAPAFDSGTASAAYAPYTGYANLFPGNSRSTTTPYFTNQAGGILGGALAGSQIAKMFL